MLIIFKKITAEKTLKLDDIAVFLRQFSTLVAAGVPLLRSCDILAKCAKKNLLRSFIYSLQRNINTGKNLAFSFRQYIHYFDELTCQLINIGEHTGQLDQMLDIVVIYYEKNLILKRKIQQALFYPLLMISLSIILITGLLIFVIPQFSDLFHDISKLPLLTRCIFYLANNIAIYIGCLIFLISFLTFIFFLEPAFLKIFKKYCWQSLLKFPIVASFVQKIYLSRFSRHLGIIFNAGIPLDQGLKLMARDQRNTSIQKLLQQLHLKICAGQSLHQAMNAFPYFPSLLIHMVKIGEETGRLDHMLDKTADFIEAEIEQQASYFSKLLEPLIMIFLGVLIGGLVMGIYLPIINLGSAF